MDGVEQAHGFGYKCAWLAVPSADPDAVMARLRIQDARQTPWREGIKAVYRHDHDDTVVYVTPSIEGWVLVAGTSLFSAIGELGGDEVVASLSATLGTVVQYFATHRVSEAHTWILADSGRLVRAYSLVENEVLFDKGERTAAEKELRIDFDRDTEEPPFSKENQQAWREWLDRQVNEEMVLRVASRWSLNPSTLEQRQLPRGQMATLGRNSFGLRRR